MEYSAHELSQLSGITPRTLRWYDRIGLLKPARVGSNGYRYYGAAEVDRLQDILYYRALGVELSRLREYLDAPSFDRMQALKGHLATLRAQREQIERLIASVQDTISAQERKENMSDQKKFEAFKQAMVQENEQKYGREVRQKYGDAEMDAGNAAMMGLSESQYQEWKALDCEIKERLENAMKRGISAQSQSGREIYELHKRWIAFTMKGYDGRRHKGIAELYVMDERFTAYYDANISGCAQLLRDAVIAWMK